MKLMSLPTCDDSIISKQKKSENEKKNMKDYRDARDVYNATDYQLVKKLRSCTNYVADYSCQFSGVTRTY